ncbi:NAD(P)H-dependent flavin oxidoreductase [Chloroflexota bacterium]
MRGNRVCRLFGIKYPIIQGGMLEVSCPELAAAISKAGGLGMLSGVKSAEDLRRDIKRTKELTDKPFGVNLPIAVLKDSAPELAVVAAEERVKVAATTAGSPNICTRQLKEAGVVVMHVAATVNHALRAESAGVDAVVASGVEAGGFLGHDELTTLVLVPQVADAVKIPVIAAGGIADARGFVACLALGAEGIQMGTRFIATKECPVGADYKQAILKAAANSTEVTNRGKAPARNFRADFVREMSLDSSVSYGAGQVAGLIEDIPTVAELFDAMIHMASLINNRIGETLSELP